MTNSDFRINDRVFGGVFGQPQREFRVREISESGALCLQEVGGPRLPLWISQNTAVAWAVAEAHADDEARRDEQCWTIGAIVDVEAMAHAENERRTPPANPFSADYTQPLTDFERAAGVVDHLATGTAWINPPAPTNRVTDPATRTTADALRDTSNHHQGSRVHAADAGHQRDMRRAGLVGPRGGLTRRGSIAAEQVRNAALDEAFGPL